jgi:hypothetical protein
VSRTPSPGERVQCLTTGREGIVLAFDPTRESLSCEDSGGEEHWDIPVYEALVLDARDDPDDDTPWSWGTWS